MRRTFRPILGISALFALMLVTVSPAGAHTGISPSQAAEGSTETFALTIGHDCDGSPVTQLRTDLSQAFDQIELVDVDGWESELNDDSVATWTADPGFEGSTMTFEFEARVTASSGSIVPVPAIQTCVEGDYAWIQVPGEGEEIDEDDHNSAPAPLLTVTEGTPVEVTTTTATPETTTTVAETTTTAPPETTTVAPETTTTVAETTTTVVEDVEDEDGSSLPLVLGGLALLAAVVGGGYVAYRRRNDAGAP